MSYEKVLRKSFASLLEQYGDSTYAHDNGVLLAVPPGYHAVSALSYIIEGVHFLPGTSADVIAYKALIHNYAKLISYGAKPSWIQCNISMPVITSAWLNQFANGLGDALKRHGGSITSAALANGKHGVAVSSQGLVPHHLVDVVEHTPNAGDKIFVTGTLGDAGLALERILQDIPNDDALSKTLEERLMRPKLPLDFAVAVRPLVSSSVTISDGFMQDLARVLGPEKLGARIMLADMPLSEEIQAIIERNAAYQCALTGADDYQLCFTVDDSNIDRVHALAEDHGCLIRCVGALTKGGEISVYDSYGALYPVKAPDHDHFAELDVSDSEDDTCGTA